MKRLLLFVMLVVMSAGSARADSLFAIDRGRDGKSNFYALNPGDGPPTKLFPVGIGFDDAALAFNPFDGQFYAIGNAGGQSSLYSFGLDGAVSKLFGFGRLGFIGGLALDTTGAFYALSQASVAGKNVSSFNAIDLVAMKATRLFDLIDGTVAFNGGLVFDPNDDKFYAIANDPGGNSSLYSFNLTGAKTKLFGVPPKSFTGGLAFDLESGLFFGIENERSGASHLFSINLDRTVTKVEDLGPGFLGGVTSSPTIPEPGTMLLLLSGLGGMAAVRKVRKRWRR